MIDAARLPERAADRARRVFTRLAEAEAKVHKTTVEKVHFHEVGAVDSIIDVVGACVALEQLGIDRVLCAPIPLGRGTIRCDHGLMPVPAPATAELVRGAATTPGVNEGELTTPTAAALFTTLAEAYGPPPEMTPSTIGWGAGTRDEGPLPNLLRVIIAESAESEADAVVELSANLDDCTGEVLGGAIEALLTAGCLDAWATPAVMKKSRPAWVLSAVCAPGDVAAVESVLFEHTTTFGVRRSLRSRTRLDRRFETVETPFGPIRVKLGIAGQRVVTASPEFEDCAQAARSHHASPREVMQAALQAYHAGSAT
jgi:hypothetical protein